MSEFIFRSLRVLRMPGIRQRYELGPFASGVNVVFGANGSGKTTTARSLESLLWPRASAPEQAWLEAHFAADGNWSVGLDSHRIEFQREGAPHDAPILPPPTDRDRYHLSLHELLWADDVGFARAIAVEGAGGYDLHAAAEHLERRSGPQSFRSERRDLDAATAALRDAEREQRALLDRGERLREREERLEGRASLDSRRALLRISLERTSTADELEEVRGRLAHFNPVLERLHGDEAERVAALRSELRDATKQAEAAAAEQTTLGRDLEALGIADPARLQEECETLTLLAEDLDQVDGDILRATNRLAEQGERVRRAADALSLDDGHLAAPLISGDDLRKIIATARNLEEERARRLEVEGEIDHLDRVMQAPVNQHELDLRVQLLRRWLRAPGPLSERQDRWPGLAAVALALVLGLVLATVRPVALITVAIAATIAWYLVRRGRDTSERAEARRALEENGVRPVRWEVPEVTELLARTERESLAAAAAAQEIDRRGRLESQLERLRAKEAPLREAFEGHLARHGIRTAGDHLVLSVLIERIERWQQARAEEAGARAALDSASDRRDSLLAEANDLLAQMGEPQAAAGRDLRVRERRVSERMAKYTELDTRIRIVTGQLEEAERTVKRVEGALSALHERLAIGAEDEARLAELCAERPAYRETRREVDLLESTLARADRRLREYADFDPALLESPIPEREAELDRIEGELEGLDRLREEVGGLRREIEIAKEGHAVEDALARVERAGEALRAARERDLEACIAEIVVNHVEKATRDANLPVVFHRASSLFTRITHGRYALRLDGASEPAFRAFDTESERSHALEELSSATRLQLLLAVRVAFVEAQERGLRLPLVMDETLANSDDPRALAIMEAVVELAGDGRQIFYFTAQPDEVRKWRDVLARYPEVDSAVLDLGEARSLAQRLSTEALAAESEPRPEPPAPDGADHNEYGRRLGVPRIDVFAPVGALHLWYLIDDPNALYEVIRTLRAERWGPLAHLLTNGGHAHIAGELPVALEDFADLAAHALKLLQIGRGRGVDRAALLASEAVTPRFMDEVEALAQRVDGDAARLLAGLEAREVPGFRASNLEALANFLEAEGYLDHQTPLTRSDLRVALLSRLSGSGPADGVTLAQLEGLVDRLCRGSGVPEDEREEDDPTSVQPTLF